MHRPRHCIRARATYHIDAAPVRGIAYRFGKPPVFIEHREIGAARTRDLRFLGSAGRRVYRCAEPLGELYGCFSIFPVQSSRVRKVYINTRIAGRIGIVTIEHSTSMTATDIAVNAISAESSRRRAD